MITKMAINFMNPSITDTQAIEFFQAIQYEYAGMLAELLTEEIKKLDSKIANNSKRYDEEEIAGFQAAKTKKETARKERQDKQKELQSTYDTVIANMTLPDKNGYANNTDAVRTVLRIVASCQENKLTKYAIIPAFENEILFQALEAVHITSVARENGAISETKEVKEAYKMTKDELERVVKDMFSLPVETCYTEKMRVKLNNADIKRLHDCYVTGYQDNFEYTELDPDSDSVTISYKDTTIKTLVSSRQNKKTGTWIRNYTKLAGVIASIVRCRYFK